MYQNIVLASKLPRATAKEKDGIVLYWVEELGIAGIHQRGVSKLLDCNPKTVAEALKGVKEISLLESEIITPGGLQGVTLIPETDLAKLLRHIARSKAKAETRDRADDIRDRLVAAGFKLMVMMELAPAELAARAVSHLDKEIELEKLRNEGERLKIQASQSELSLMAFRDTVLKLQPQSVADRILGVQTIEKVEIRTKIVDENDRILNAGETVSKTQLAERYGFVTKSGKADTKVVTQLIEQAIEAGAIEYPWRDVRVVASAGFDAEQIDKLDRFFKASPMQRQRWIGE